MIADLLKNTKPFGQLVALFLIFFACFMVASAVPVLLGVDLSNLNTVRWSQMVVQIIAFLLSSILFCTFFYGKPKQFFCLNASPRIFKQTLIGALIMVLLVPFTDWLTVWNDNIHFQGALASLEESLRSAGRQSEALMLQLLDVNTFGALMFNLLVLALVPAVCEEFFFRGALQRLFSSWFSSKHLAIFITAALFSLFHGELFAFLPRLLLGLALGYLFYFTNSMFVNIVAHFTNNALIVILAYLHGQNFISFSPADPLQVSWMWTILSAVSALLLLICYILPDSSSNSAK